jgi:uncharacterized protein YggU (UPF0235/DUF167 family)
MRIFVKVKPNSKENKVTPPNETLFKSDEVKSFYLVSVKDPPVDGKANDAVIRELATHFRCTRSEIRLVSGVSSKLKAFEIDI